MQHDIDIDKIVDYKAEYSAVIERPKIAGSRLTGLCPFHDDKNASFSANLETGTYKCFACGAEGNFLTFWASMHNISTGQAYKEIIERYHAEPVKQIYTVDQYAAKKRLPADWLRKVFSLSDGTEKTGEPFIRIPYYAESGAEQLFRKRYADGAPVRFKWKYGSAGKLLMYGEWRLPHFREADRTLILVEGESDTQTLYFLGFPALGIPGASTFRPEWTRKLKGIDALYLHVEPDTGGKTFQAQMVQKLHDGGYEGDVFIFSCGVEGVKDPSDLYIRDGKEEASKKLAALIRGARQIDIRNIAEAIPEAVPGEPVHLRQPDGWSVSEKGIASLNEKEVSSRIVCRTPILISRRLRSIETGDEKIELSWRRDGEWHSSILPRSVAFQAKSITCLADQGATVTSENARNVVKYLSALESENIDVIEQSRSTSTFGWQSAKEFLPGHADGIVLDIDQSLRSWAAAYAQSGSLAEWIGMMEPHRARYRFRFILASAFTAPLLRILRQRIFMVYNWGGSKGGKSAALKAALSAWGDPERLMVNFNATAVALERMAGFYCDLPLGIDERQLAGKSQGTLEKIVYMLASGTGRIRGNKTGGLQTLSTWRTVVLATGEEPIATETSQTGVNTRVLEIYGEPFDDEVSAGIMHQDTARHYGWAGIAFLDHVIREGEEPILRAYNAMRETVDKELGGKNMSHAAGISAVAAADMLLSQWIFGESPEDAEREAKDMALRIVADNAENASRDVNEDASDFVMDWIASNMRSFHGEGYQKFGEFQDRVACIFPSILIKALTDAGFSPRKTLKYMAEKGIVETSVEDGSVRYSVKMQIGGKRLRMIRIKYGEPQLPPPVYIPLVGQNGAESVRFDDVNELPF